MRRFGVEVARDGWSSFYRAGGCTLSKSRRNLCRGRCLVGVVFSGRRRDQRSDGRRAGARRRCRAGEHPGRRAVRGHVARDGRGNRDGRQLDRVASAGAAATRKRKLKAIDADFNHIPDAAMTLAVAALFADGPSVLAQHRQLAGQGDRSHRGHGDRIAQTRRAGRRGRGLSCASRRPLRCGPQPSTPTTITAWRCVFRWRRSGGVAVRINDPRCVAKTFPEYFDVFARNRRSDERVDGFAAGDRD